jgi:hypothetical protein
MEVLACDASHPPTSTPDPVDRFGDRRFRTRRPHLQRSMWSLSVVVPGVLGQHPAEVPLPEDQHPVGDSGSNRQHEATFGEAVRPWAAGRDRDHLDACICPHRVERRGESSGPVATRNRNRAVRSPRSI